MVPPENGSATVEARDYELNQILSDIDKILGIFDCIPQIQILGGEPLMFKKLEPVLEKIKASKKIGAIKVVTNGTILPDASLIQCLKHRKVQVFVSGYPEDVAKNQKKLLELLKTNNVKYNFSPDTTWRDSGGIGFRNRGERALFQTFAACVFKGCTSFQNGQIHLCARSSHGMTLGIVPDNKNDYVDVRAISTEKARQKFKQLLKKKYISACNYCD